MDQMLSAERRTFNNCLDTRLLQRNQTINVPWNGCTMSCKVIGFVDPLTLLGQKELASYLWINDNFALNDCLLAPPMIVCGFVLGD